jgi:hypothetical protein
VTLPPTELFVPELGVLTIVPVAPLAVELVLLLELVLVLVELFAWPLVVLDVLLLVVLDVLLLVVLDVLLLEDPDEPKPAVPDLAEAWKLVECELVVVPGLVATGLWP